MNRAKKIIEGEELDMKVAKPTDASGLEIQETILFFHTLISIAGCLRIMTKREVA